LTFSNLVSWILIRLSANYNEDILVTKQLENISIVGWRDGSLTHSNESGIGISIFECGESKEVGMERK
jgi:hypothetical protein